ncbi:MAG: hypothetical protein WC877_00195 [Dehalococcoidales bacterium]|jgi:hypothetical protein
MADTNIQFTLWKEVKSKDNDYKTEWTNIGDLPDETFIDDIQVTTVTDSQVIEVGTDPVVMPLGAKSRDCKIVGSFKDSISNSASYVLNQELTDSIYTSDDGNYLSRAISVKIGNNLIPELGNAKWKIKSFTWNKEVTSGQRFKFEMELGYVFENQAELQIYDKNCAINKPENIQFAVVPLAYLPSKLITWTGPIVYNVRIEKSLLTLNKATFKIASQVDVFPENTPIAIFCSSNKSKPVFVGYIKEITSNKDLSQTYDCNEIGALLQDIPVKNFNKGIFVPRVKIPNPVKKNRFLSLSEIIIAIMTHFQSHNKITWYNPGSGSEKTSITYNVKKYGNSIYIPGREGVTFPPQMLSGISIGKAIDNFIQNQCGMYSWYALPDGKLEYGFYNNYITINPESEFIEASVRCYTNNETIDPDYVIVWNSDSTVWAVHGIQKEFAVNGEEFPSAGVGIGYIMNSTLLDRELSLIAKKIYDDLKINTDQFRVNFPAGTVRFNEGDVFLGLGDQTTFPSMPYRSGVDLDPFTNSKDSIWQIRDMTITEESTEVIVGTSYRSVFDIYRNELVKKDEVPSPTEVEKWSSNIIYTNIEE